MTRQEKEDIAHSLLNGITTKKNISKKAALFITDWIMSGPEEKNKDDYDIWGIILEVYEPIEFPTLYRTTTKFNEGKIESYTGRLLCANKMKEEEDYLLIVETKKFEFLNNNRFSSDEKCIFFPIGRLLKNESQLVKTNFTKSVIDKYVKEDEYIMRTKKIFTQIYKEVEI